MAEYGNYYDLIPSGVTNTGGSGSPVVGSSAQNSGSNVSDWISWQDLFMPGYSIFNKMFDFTGKNAAEQQYQNQLALTKQAQAFNASEAEKQRQWEQAMSSSAMQRQVSDLKAAGLNPYIMMAGQYGGNGASTPSGSSASSSPGSADMANNKLAAAAGVLAIILRVLLTKH